MVDLIFWGLVFLWIGLAISARLFFRGGADRGLKRKVLPLVVLLAGALFAGFAAYVSRWQPFVLTVILPAIGVITLLHLRTTKFCEGCDRLLYNQPLFGRGRCCPRCGGAIDRQDEPGEGPTRTRPAGHQSDKDGRPE